MDSLSEILQATRLSARVFLHSSFCGQWAVDTSGSQHATFHVVARGTCWLHMQDMNQPEPLRAGDLVVFPRDAAHTISNSECPPGPELVRNRPAPAVADGPTTSLICGYFEFGENHWDILLECMPAFLVIRNEVMSETGHMNALIDFMIFEAEANRQGSDVVINRLSDVLFIHVVRNYISQHKPANGIIAAIADTRLAKGLSAFHQDPGGNWTVEQLAKASGMSRSAFSEYFHRLIGQTPLQYVTQWRMYIAHELLTSSQHSMLSIAEKSGYLSEASFAKVYKKYFGVGPGAVRRKKMQLPHDSNMGSLSDSKK